MGEREIKYWLHVLGDDVVGAEEKMEAVEGLTGAGKDAMPFLIERLLDRKDARFLIETRVHQGPLQAQGDATLQTTVRYMVETILYRIIAPQRRPLEKKTKLDALKPKITPPDTRTPIPWVADWGLFWRAHKSHSLADMKAWSAEELDRRWLAIDDGEAPSITPASLSGPPVPTTVASDDDKKAYAKVRALYLEARRDSKKVTEAKKALATIGASNARVKVHADFMAAALR